MLIQIKCRKCKTVHTIEVEETELQDYMDGKKMVQECFPNMSSNIREMFVSQICPECWRKQFANPKTG